MVEGKIEFYFGEDHERLDHLLEEFQAVKACSYSEAKRYFGEFKTGLLHHIKLEEDILFPWFETKAGMANLGPTVAMRLEHRQIEAALEKLRQRVDREDPESDEEETALFSILEGHNRKEESILYPILDQMTSKEEREVIFERIDKFRRMNVS